MESRLLVICDNPSNVFVKELKKRKIIFQLVDRLINDSQLFIHPLSTALLINKGQAEGVKIKKTAPVDKVLLCYGGGKKDFAPYIISVQSNLDHDYYNYGSWSEFVDLVTKELPAQTKFMKRLENEKYQLTRLEEVASNAALPSILANNFRSTIECSLSYLDWLLSWSLAVASIRFEQKFSYTTQKKIKNLFIPLAPERLVYKGKSVFTEDDEITFTLVNGKTVLANVKSVAEDGLTIGFQARKSPEIINDIRYFTVRLDTGVISKYKKYCLSLAERNRGNDYPAPLDVLRGDRHNYGVGFWGRLTLNSAEEKIQRDQSQIKALDNIFGPNFVTPVEGPPGTGKTFVIAVAINQLLDQGKMIIVTSHSNQGLDNILERVADLVPIEDHNSLFRLGNNCDSISATNRRFHRSQRYKEEAEEKENGRDKIDKLSGERDMSLVSLIELNDILGKINRAEKGVVLFVTLNSLILDSTMKMLLENTEIDIGFIDEATKGYLYEILPLLLKVQTKIVLIGDHRQLGNISLPEEAKVEIRKNPRVSYEDAESFSMGFFANLVKKQLLPSNLLIINRRSLPKIAGLVSSVFYQGLVISGRFNPFDEGQIKFIDTKSLTNNQDSKRNTSFCNKLEARLVVKQFIGLAKDCLSEGKKITDCAIITPYQAQIQVIKKELRPALLFNSTLKIEPERIDDLLNELVNTVDAFQGSERYGVILSLVRSNQANEIGFNSDIRRLNVAVSRAQDKLVIIGNSTTFTNYYQTEVSEIFKSILRYVKKHGRYIELRGN
jgi:hypothetical protein